MDAATYPEDWLQLLYLQHLQADSLCSAAVTSGDGGQVLLLQSDTAH